MKLVASLAFGLTLASATLLSVVASVEETPSVSSRELLQYVERKTDFLDQAPTSYLRSTIADKDKTPERGLLGVANTLCERGVTDGCICEVDELRAAFDSASTDELVPTVIHLCYGSDFLMESPIDITGKAFSLICVRPEQCYFRGSSSNVFVGAPKVATFVFLKIRRGEAVQGGAMHFTGGKIKFVNLLFSDNFTNTTGGAVYLEGEGTELAFTGTIFQDNIALGSGAAIAVANGARVKSIRSSYMRNEAEVSGGAIYNDGGFVNMSISLMSNNKAPSGNDIYITSDETRRAPSQVFVDCDKMLVNTFCGGKDGIVEATSGTGSSTNCKERGIFKYDPRCTVLDLTSP